MPLTCRGAGPPPRRTDVGTGDATYTSRFRHDVGTADATYTSRFRHDVGTADATYTSRFRHDVGKSGGYDGRGQPPRSSSTRSRRISYPCSVRIDSAWNWMPR